MVTRYKDNPRKIWVQRRRKRQDTFPLGVDYDQQDLRAWEG
jgi:hypothetical protein